MENTNTENVVLEPGEIITIWCNILEEWSAWRDVWTYVGPCGDGDTHIVEDANQLRYRIPGDEIQEICQGY